MTLTDVFAPVSVFLAAGALFYAGWALRMQSRELRLQREELELQRAEMKKSSAALEAQVQQSVEAFRYRTVPVLGTSKATLKLQTRKASQIPSLVTLTDIVAFELRAVAVVFTRDGKTLLPFGHARIHRPQLLPNEAANSVRTSVHMQSFNEDTEYSPQLMTYFGSWSNAYGGSFVGFWLVNIWYDPDDCARPSPLDSLIITGSIDWTEEWSDFRCICFAWYLACKPQEGREILTSSPADVAGRTWSQADLGNFDSQLPLEVARKAMEVVAFSSFNTYLQDSTAFIHCELWLRASWEIGCRPASIHRSNTKEVCFAYRARGSEERNVNFEVFVTDTGYTFHGPQGLFKTSDVGHMKRYILGLLGPDR